jgi:hypothetical protein
MMTRSFETKNVILWLANDARLYTAMTEYAKNAESVSYRHLIWALKLENAMTPDGIRWLDDCLDFEDLDFFVTEIGGAGGGN